MTTTASSTPATAAPAPPTRCRPIADRDGAGGACDADEPPLRRWRPADGRWPADRAAPRIGARVESGLAVRVTCSERCFVDRRAALAPRHRRARAPRRSPGRA